MGVRLFRTQGERDALQQQQRVATLELNLSSAADRFCSNARQAVDSGDHSFTAAQLARLKSALAERDAAISLVTQADAAAERLTTIYVTISDMSGLPSPHQGRAQARPDGTAVLEVPSPGVEGVARPGPHQVPSGGTSWWRTLPPPTFAREPLVELRLASLITRSRMRTR